MLLRNYYLILEGGFTGRTKTLTNVSGTKVDVYFKEYSRSWFVAGSPTYCGFYMQLNSPEGNTDYGIVVGTSDTPVSLYDYYINKIPHGTSSGQLYYYATEVKDVVVNGNIIELEVARKLSNQTDDDILVNEFGVIAKVSGYFLIAREVSPTTVPSGGLLEVSFKFKTTV